MPSAVPPQFTSQTAPGALIPDDHQGYAITGLPVPFYLGPVDF